MEKVELAKSRATLTVPECAEILGIGRNTAYQLAKTGRLPVLRLGRRLVVTRAALEKLLAGDWQAPEEDGFSSGR